jgi:hypothetical protein
VRVVGRLRAWLRGDLSEADLASTRGGAGDVYELVDALPPGAAREAAWAAYALQTYGDKLVASDEGYVSGETAAVAAEAFRLASSCLGADADALPRGLPRWRTPHRSEAQLAGMRDALEALRTYIAYELRGRADDADRSGRLAEIDADLRRAEQLWIARDSADIRGGLAGVLARGLDRAYTLGRAVTSG